MVVIQTMKWFLVLVCAFWQTNAKNCDHLGVLLYEDIACNPVNSKPDDCPSHFDCENHEPSKDHCLFQGRHIASGEVIDNNITYHSCNVGCHCTKRDDEQPKFTCAVLDCPEWLGVPVKAGCYRKYKVGECCAAGEICPPLDEEAVCKVGEKTYKEGERFNPKDSCIDCVCQKGFTGEFVEPFCKRQSCSVELKHTNDIENNCAPVYYKSEEEKALCCPSSWTCPTSKEVDIKPYADGNAELSCRFGEKQVKGNEQFTVSIEEYGQNREVNCKCLMPPLLTCTGKW